MPIDQENNSKANSNNIIKFFSHDSLKSQNNSFIDQEKRAIYQEKLKLNESDRILYKDQASGQSNNQIYSPKMSD